MIFARKKAQAVLFTLALSIMFSFFKILDPVPLQIIRSQWFDYLQVTNPREEPDTPYAMVIDIDEKSLKEIGQWPWPRTYVAQMMLHAFQDGAAAIATDVMFSEPDRTSPARVAQSNPYLAEALGDAVKDMPDNDQILADLIAQVPVVLGYGISPDGSSADGIKNSNIAILGVSPLPFLPDTPGVLKNLEILEQAATSVGNYMPLPEPDGIVRRIPLFLKQGDNILNWLALEALMAATGQDTVVIRSNELGIEEVVLADVVLPTDRFGRMWVPFRSYNKDKFYVSASDVFNNTFEPGTFSGKVLFLGASAVGLGDLHTFPFGKAIPGVEMHVQTIEAIMEQKFIFRPEALLSVEVVTVLLSTLLIALLVSQLGAVKSFIFLTLFTASQFIISYYLFINNNILFDVTALVTFTVFMFIITSTLAFIREERQKAYVKNAFSQYLSPELVSQLVKNPEKLKLGGESKDLTLLFCDIRGFTSMSETLKDNPEHLTTIVNMLLTELTGVVMKHGGTIDKYMGDALMAFWNAPLDDPKHKENAILAAVELQKSMKTVNEKLSEFTRTQNLDGVPFMRVGVGVSSGLVTVGNMGSLQRFNYSVIGDAVNLAARLEGQTKNYGLTNLISEFAISGLSEDLAFIEVDKIRVKGKSEPVVIYSVLGDSTLANSDEFLVYKKHHTSMIESIRNRNWSEAEKFALEAMSYRKATSELYALYLDRIELYKEHPPENDWDGSYEAKSK